MGGVCDGAKPVEQSFACFSNPAGSRLLSFVLLSLRRALRMGFGDPQEVRKWDNFNCSLDNPLYRGKKIGIDFMFYLHLPLCRGADQMLHPSLSP